MTPKPNRAALPLVMAIVMMDAVGVGIVLPVLPDLYVDLTGRPLSDAALLGGALVFLFALLQFVFSPVIGNLSDRFGRRPILLLSMASFGVNYWVMALAPSVFWLFVGRIATGVFAATYSASSAYIADITPPEKRAANFGLIGAGFGIGFILGPVIGGLLGELSPRTPFFVAGGLALLTAAIGLFVLPETLPVERRRPFSLARANPLGAFRAMSALPTVLGLAFVYGFIQFANQTYPATWAFYGKALFDWTPAQLGLSLFMVGLATAVVQGGLTRVLIPRWGEVRCAVIGLSGATLAMFGFGLAQSVWVVYLCIGLSALNGLATPAIQSLMSARVGADAQGELQGALASLQGLALIITPPTATALFYVFTREGAPIFLPGAQYLVGGVLMAIALGLFLNACVKPKAQAPAE